MHPAPGTGYTFGQSSIFGKGAPARYPDFFSVGGNNQDTAGTGYPKGSLAQRYSGTQEPVTDRNTAESVEPR